MNTELNRNEHGTHMNAPCSVHGVIPNVFGYCIQYQSYVFYLGFVTQLEGATFPSIYSDVSMVIILV
jgi:hypothetical protein